MRKKENADVTRKTKSRPIVNGILGLAVGSLGGVLIQGALAGFTKQTISLGLGAGLVAGFIVFVITLCYEVVQEGHSFYAELEKRLVELWTARIVDLLPFNDKNKEFIGGNSTLVQYKELVREFIGLRGNYEWSGAGCILRQRISSPDYLTPYAQWVTDIKKLCTIKTYKTVNTLIPMEIIPGSQADFTLSDLNKLTAENKYRLQVICPEKLKIWWRDFLKRKKREEKEASAEAFAEEVIEEFKKFNAPDRYGRGWEVHYIFKHALLALNGYPKEYIIINDSIMFILTEDDKVVNLFTGAEVIHRYREIFDKPYRLFRPRQDDANDFKEDLEHFLIQHSLCPKEDIHEE